MAAKVLGVRSARKSVQWTGFSAERADPRDVISRTVEVDVFVGAVLASTHPTACFRTQSISSWLALSRSS